MAEQIWMLQTKRADSAEKARDEAENARIIAEEEKVKAQNLFRTS